MTTLTQRGLMHLALPATLASLAGAQTVLHDFEGDGFEDRFGNATAAAGDVNQDGVPDYITSGLQLGVGDGYARVFSGLDGATLHTFAAPDLAPLAFGHAVGGGADLDMDGHDDVVISAYAYLSTSPGFVRAFSGKDGSVLGTWQGDQDRDAFGQSCTLIPDVNGDGRGDLLVGADQSHMNGPGYVRMLSGSDGSTLYTVDNTWGGFRFGRDLAVLEDLDGDDVADFVVGHPSSFGGLGAIRVFSGATGAFLFEGLGNAFGDQMGYRVGNAGDVNGDGKVDIIAGMWTGTSTKSYVKVYSGADGATLHTLISEFPNDREFGSDVDSAGDVDGDGYADLAISATSVIPQAPGYVRVYSGLTGQLLVDHRAGFYLDNIGFSLANVGDLNGDGIDELAAGSGYTCCGTNFPNGFLRVLTPCPVLSEAYCVAKVNFEGCTPAIGWSGSPTLTGPDDFVVTATNVLNQKNGLLFYGYASTALPFLGGTLCVAPPVLRTSVQGSGGNPPPSDCSGNYAFPFTQARMVGDGLAPGTSVFAQYWTRDPSHPDLTGVGLTNAIRFTICD